jgi:hypothetical protein
MAKTSRKKAAQLAVGRQAPTGAWTPDQLASVFQDRSDAERVEALKLAGIIDEKGNITPLYKSWGKKVTRTPDADA